MYSIFIHFISVHKCLSLFLQLRVYNRSFRAPQWCCSQLHLRCGKQIELSVKPRILTGKICTYYYFVRNMFVIEPGYDSRVQNSIQTLIMKTII